MQEGHWKIVSAVLLLLAVVATLIGPVGQRYFWRPDVVYEVLEANTILGPGIKKDIAEITTRRLLEDLQVAVDERNEAGVENAEEVAGLMEDVRWETLKRNLSPDRVFPERYVRLRVLNRGRTAANNLQIAVSLPGVLVESRVQCAARPQLDLRQVKAFDNEIPVGVVLPAEVSEFVPGDEILLEIWYSASPESIHEDPGFAHWPDELQIAVQHADGVGVRIDPTKSLQDSSVYWAIIVMLLLFLAMPFAIVRWPWFRRGMEFTMSPVTRLAEITYERWGVPDDKNRSLSRPSSTEIDTAPDDGDES